MPGVDGFAHRLRAFEPAVDALATENAQFHFGHVETAAATRSMNDAQPLGWVSQFGMLRRLPVCNAQEGTSQTSLNTMTSTGYAASVGSKPPTGATLRLESSTGV